MPLFFPQQRASGSADTAVRRWRRKTPCLRARRVAACGGRECRCSPAGMPPSGGGDKRGQGHRMVPLPPLDSPKPSFALTHRRCAAKRELRGLGSVRRADFGTLSGPEVSLRKPPRITVRGQTVQGGGVPLRKAPLPSSVYSWSTRRPCGPLAFRRATGGSRVLRKMRGSQEGDKKPFGVLSPFCPCRWAPAPPRPWDTASVASGGKAYPLLRVKKKRPCLAAGPLETRITCSYS